MYNGERGASVRREYLLASVQRGWRDGVKGEGHFRKFRRGRFGMCGRNGFTENEFCHFCRLAMGNWLQPRCYRGVYSRPIWAEILRPS